VSSDDAWLTVVTVVKDDAEGLGKTLDSLVGQSLTGVEYIVVDSSTDATQVESTLVRSGLSGVADYLLEWSEPAGIYAAMNLGLSLAHGDYIYFLNAGDSFFDTQVLADIGEVVRQNSPDWIVGRVQVQEKSGRTSVSADWDYDREKRALFARGLFPPHQGTFVKTKALRAMGGFNLKYSIAADYLAALSLSKTADPVVTNRVIARFIEGGTSTLRWQESFREFHRARIEEFQPKGWSAVVERLRTFSHYTRVWLVRTLR